MKTVQSISEARALALRSGAELVGPSGRFNAGRQQHKGADQRGTPAGPPTAPAVPIEAPAGGLTHAQVEQMIATHNARVAQQIASIIATIQQAPAAAAPTEWAFEISYDDDKAITGITAKAKP